MTDNWDRTLFDKELKAILESKLPVSASKITGLQSLATAHPKHHNYIIQCITRFIETAPPDYRLAGLYVIDAISRAVHKQQRKREENNEGPHEADGYLKRFAIVLKDDALIGCFEPCSPKDKDKVKKTLDFWEQGNVYSKEMVQYVKRSFLNSSFKATAEQQQEKVTPPVDTALLLATLSNIGNGSLANLNIPGLVTTPSLPAPTTTTTTTTASLDPATDILPPALAKLLGGLVSTPTTASIPPITTNTTTTTVPMTTVPAPVVAPTVSDPRIRNDPRQRPPQGPSIPRATGTGERKSRWGNATDTQQMAPVVDPWLQRQSIGDPRTSFQPPPPQQQQQQQQPSRSPYTAPPYQQQQQPYQQQQHHHHNQQQQQQAYQPSSYQTSSYQSSYQPSYQQHASRSNSKGADPVHDPSLPAGCIKVLTRTLFVGPIPDHYEKEDVSHLFSKYGELASVIVSKKLKGRHNAFLKFLTRASTEAAKYGSVGLMVDDVPVKVNWAFGFGPKKHFNYDRGDSIIPLAELSDEEKDNLMTAPVGGFGGQPVRPCMTVEEPEAQYRPEWKTDDQNRAPVTAGFKRQQSGVPGSGANFEEIRKRGRFSSSNSSHHEPPVMGNRGQGFYQQYDPSISVNPYSDRPQ
ncbi:uncharacterized protein EV154DRAFT_563011 [Mucor mucedo]|uniref:uncharacterized protein n=1 Tax=Mucor mucedo TaxID=29922 RepID=UPI00222069A8|nr:uncharacterized protein EV154DRAFT_563011 [Mucor mucedo]KAI7891745.1 hypothetical protein EV154DRAFT_563011 [Mucor mucedo]